MKTKPCRFILLDSKEPTNLIVLDEDKKLYQIPENSLGRIFKYGYKEIILISLDTNDKIEVGDTVLTPNNYVTKVYGKLGELLECSGDGEYDESELKKVIATQKQLSPEIINQFIQQYNKGEVKDVNIEMEEIEIEDYTDTTVDMYDQDIEYEPKLINGFINIINKN